MSPEQKEYVLTHHDIAPLVERLRELNAPVASVQNEAIAKVEDNMNPGLDMAIRIVQSFLLKKISEYESKGKKRGLVGTIIHGILEAVAKWKFKL